MARLTERAFENAVVRLRDGQGALGQSALDVLHEQREELANQMLARLAGSDEFAAMLERNFGPYRRLMTYYECAMMEVETKFRVLDAEFGLQHDRNTIESIKSRLKSTDSLEEACPQRLPHVGGFHRGEHLRCCRRARRLHLPRRYVLPGRVAALPG